MMMLLLSVLFVVARAEPTSPPASGTDVFALGSSDSPSPSHFEAMQAPTGAPTESFQPTSGPSVSPSKSPTPVPSPIPSFFPTSVPSAKPTGSSRPTGFPSMFPTSTPTLSPTTAPTFNPTFSPSNSPTVSSRPTSLPSWTPTRNPSAEPSPSPSLRPSVSMRPSTTPSLSAKPSATPSEEPSVSALPSMPPSVSSFPSVQPTTSPTRSPTTSAPVSPPKKEEKEERPPVMVIVVTMLGAVLVTIGCGCNQHKTVVDDFENAEQAAADFHEEIQTNRRFILTIPEFTICGCTCRRREYVLFFSSRIKARWLPMHTIVQMCLGWISLATTVVALFDPQNATNNVVGFTALFMNELLTHTWYGYLRYLAKGCGDEDQEEDVAFENMKYLFGILYHGGHFEPENAQLVDVLGFPFYAIMYLATFVAFFATLLVLTCLRVLGQDDEGDKNRRRQTNDDDNEGAVGFSAFVGMAMGCFAYPLMFLMFTTTAGKVFASFMHHGMSEYYEAKLFRKGPGEFFWSLVLKLFFDVVGVEDFADDGFQEALHEVNQAADPERNNPTERSEENQDEPDM